MPSLLNYLYGFMAVVVFIIYAASITDGCISYIDKGSYLGLSWAALNALLWLGLLVHAGALFFMGGA